MHENIIFLRNSMQLVLQWIGKANKTNSTLVINYTADYPVIQIAI